MKSCVLCPFVSNLLDEELGPEKGAAHPRSHSKLKAEPGPEPRFPDSQQVLHSQWGMRYCTVILWSWLSLFLSGLSAHFPPLTHPLCYHLPPRLCLLLPLLLCWLLPADPVALANGHVFIFWALGLLAAPIPQPSHGFPHNLGTHLAAP